MRKIEREMLDAIRDARNWTSGNTRVESFGHKADLNQQVFLHGNLIATYSTFLGWRITLAGWNTPTTRSRVNRIAREFTGCRGVACRKGRPVLVNNDRTETPITADQWVTL